MSPLPKRVNVFRTFWTFCIISMSLQQWKYSFFYCTVLYKCLTFNWDHGWKFIAGCHGELRVWEAKYFSYLFRVSQSSDYQGSFSNSASSISTKRRYLLTETLMEDVHSVIAMANSYILRRIIFRSKIWNLLTIRFLIQGSGTFLDQFLQLISEPLSWTTIKEKYNLLTEAIDLPWSQTKNFSPFGTFSP